MEVFVFVFGIRPTSSNFVILQNLNSLFSYLFKNRFRGFSKSLFVCSTRVEFVDKFFVYFLDSYSDLTKQRLQMTNGKLFLSHSLHTPFLSLSLSLPFSHSLSLSFTLSHSLFPILSLSHTHTLSLKLSLSHTNTL